MSLTIEDQGKSPYVECLDRRKRLPVIQEKIDAVFDSLKVEKCSSWGRYNGPEEFSKHQYNILQIPEHYLIKKLILQAPIAKKDFYFLDIGAGNFQWVKGLASFINSQKDLPNDITIHILGVRGEGGVEKIKAIGKCKTYKLTAFKIENLVEEFESRGLFLTNIVDFAISRWTFRHLVDPLGTFVRTYHLLRPGNGILLMDGFFIFDKKRNLDFSLVEASNYIFSLLLKTKAPFLLEFHLNFLNHFLLRRPNENPCPLEMTYIGLFKNPYKDAGRLEDAVQFDDLEFDKETEEEGSTRGLKNFLRYDGGITSYNYLYGDKSLYYWLRSNEAKLHEAVIRGDCLELEKGLDEGADIDEVDLNGVTALRLALKINQLSCFEFLIQRGAKTDISDYNPLNFTLVDLARGKSEGRYLELLLKT